MTITYVRTMFYMKNHQWIVDLFLEFMPLILTSVGVVIFLYAIHRLIIVRNGDLGNEKMLTRQLVMLCLTFVCIVIVALALPVSESTRNQILVLIGMLASGIFAFSSTTIFVNLLSGIMLRVTKPFTTGDFITIADYSGRVVERGLLDTEIQTEDRRLVALPNTFMIANPVSVVRGSGAIVSVTLSLGYDIHHSKVESLLLEAINFSGLKDPFIQILDLGNYSVTYKANGMLTDVKVLLTAHSNLRRHILDVLHNNKIEIMSPSFMNQRKISEFNKVIPDFVKPEARVDASVAEEVVFDKAEEAEQIEQKKIECIQIIQEYEKDLESAPAEKKKMLKAMIKESKEQLKNFEVPTEQGGD